MLSDRGLHIKVGKCHSLLLRISYHTTFTLSRSFFDRPHRNSCLTMTSYYMPLELIQSVLQRSSCIPPDVACTSLKQKLPLQYALL
jgi:hypothetical protein